VNIIIIFFTKAPFQHLNFSKNSLSALTKLQILLCCSTSLIASIKPATCFHTFFFLNLSFLFIADINGVFLIPASNHSTAYCKNKGNSQYPPQQLTPPPLFNPAVFKLTTNYFKLTQLPQGKFINKSDLLCPEMTPFHVNKHSFFSANQTIVPKMKQFIEHFSKSLGF
jgi:hypothetical protein